MVDKDITQGHTLIAFNNDLAGLRGLVLEMGELVMSQVTKAVKALIEGDVTLARRVVAQDRQVDDFDIRADEEILRVLAIRQPVATDLRLVLALSKCVQELASAGSKAKRIASFAIQLHIDSTREPRKKFLLHVQYMKDWACCMLERSLEALERLDIQKAVVVVRDDDKLDEGFDAGMRHLVTFVLEDPSAITGVLDMVFVLKALERVGDHANHIAEQVIFIAQGRDVRYLHPDFLDRSPDATSGIF